MEVPLSKIISGTFDIQAFGAEMKAEQEKVFQQKKKQEAMMAAIKPLTDANAKKDYKRVMDEYNKLTIADPSFKGMLQQYYYTALIHLDPEKSYKEAVLVKDSARNAAVIAKIFAMEEGLDKKFYTYAIDFYEGQPANMFDLPYIAGAYFNFGHIAKAVKAQQEWIDKMKTVTSPAPAEYVEKEMERLKKYKASLE